MVKRTYVIPLPCAIFAGGKSKRMGEDKTLLPFGGEKTLVAYQVKRLTPFFKHIVVVTKGDKFVGENFTVLEDCSDEFSPMVGLVTLFEQLPDQKVMVLAADTPFVSAKTLQILAKHAKEEDDVTVLQTRGKIHPMCAIYDRRVLEPLKKCIADNKHKMTLFLESVTTRYVEAGSLEELANLNTPQEYKLAQERITRCN